MELDFKQGLEGSAGTRECNQALRARPQARAEQPKIIEFPRPTIAPAVYAALDRLHQSEEVELADPIVEGPRILDAPEPPPRQLNLLPAFSDIQLEAEQDRRAGDVELPLQPAAVLDRLYAGLVDWMVVLTASALFVSVFLMFAKGLPQARLSITFGLIVCGTLWLIYQYLFLVYASATAGMRRAQLELCTFAGEPPPVGLRRKRALASTLSGFAAGLGFAWALVDDDTLGWHDRITQTYLKQSGNETSSPDKRSA